MIRNVVFILLRTVVASQHLLSQGVEEFAADTTKFIYQQALRTGFSFRGLSCLTRRQLKRFLVRRDSCSSHKLPEQGSACVGLDVSAETNQATLNSCNVLNNNTK